MNESELLAVVFNNFLCAYDVLELVIYGNVCISDFNLGVCISLACCYVNCCAVACNFCICCCESCVYCVLCFCFKTVENGFISVFSFCCVDCVVFCISEDCVFAAFDFFDNGLPVSMSMLKRLLLEFS